MKLESFSEIEGAKVRLRRFGAGDITDQYIGWLNDPEITRHSSQRFRTHTRQSCEAYLASFDGAPGLFLSIQDASEGAAIGTMTAYPNAHHLTCDVGIMIGNRDYWNGGYGSDAFTLLIDWLIEEAGVRKVTAGCLAANGAMVTLMQRAGMKADGVRKGHELLDGTPADIVHYARFCA